MTRKHVDPRYPPGAMQLAEAAWYLGMSVDHFKRHVRADLPCVYVGDMRLWRVRDLDTWLERRAVGPAKVVRDKERHPGAVATARGMAQGDRTR